MWMFIWEGVVGEDVSPVFVMIGSKIPSFKQIMGDNPFTDLGQKISS